MPKTKLVDAHIHLSDAEYSQQTDELVTNAKKTEVKALVSNSTDLETSLATLQLARKYPEMVFAAIGIHPWNVKTLKEGELEDTLKLINDQSEKKAIVAIGEIGLDSKYETVWEKQLSVFEQMLRIAEKTNLPVIVHSRGSTERIVDMLPSYDLEGVLLHWFSYPPKILTKIVEKGYLITEGPPTVYSTGIREIIEKVPLTSLLTETDGPVKYYKQPFNGQLTKPSFLHLVVKAIAEIKRIDIEETATQILINFESFFKVKLG